MDSWKNVMLGRRKDMHAGMEFGERKGMFHTVKACVAIRQIWQFCSV
jgi:hypothetical protein